MGNAEDGNHQQHGEGNHPAVVLPPQGDKRGQEEQERQQCLVVRQIGAVGESRPPRAKGRMLNKWSEDEPADKQSTHRYFQPTAVWFMRHHQQERIDCKEHGAKHQQDMGYQDIGWHIVAETYHHGLIFQIVLARHRDIILQLASDRLNGQSGLPLTLLPREIHRCICVRCRIAAIVQLRLSTLRHTFQPDRLVVLHTAAGQFYLTKGGEFDFSPTNENYHILEKDVWGGKLSYAEDISGITESNKELKEISERLLEENALQEAENSLQEDRVHVSVMNKLYDDISEFSSGKTEEIEKLLNCSGSDADFKKNLEKACILASYIKRRGNLYLLGEENRQYDFNDLYLSFKESLDYFALNGVKTLLTTGSRAKVDKDAGLKAYDCLESYLEKLFGRVKSLLVHIEATENELKIRFMYDEDTDTETFPFLTGYTGKEAEL